MNRCKKRKSIDMIYELKEFYDCYLIEDHNDLHIIFDDGNIKNNHVEFCKEESLKKENYVAAQICSLLEQFTEKEREILLSKNFNNYCF